MNNILIELINNKEVFDYKTECSEEAIIKVYKRIEEIFNSLFKKYSKLYEIENCVFYYDNLRYCTSSATNIANELNVIKLSCAYPNLMYDKLFLNNNLKENEIVKKQYKELLSDNFDFKEYFLQCSVRFTFFHEFRHLIQFENKSNIFSEKIDSEFSLEKHALEIDADLFSIRYIIDYVYDIFENLNTKTEQTFQQLMFLSLGSVFSTNLLYYFKDIDLMKSKKISNDFKDEFYTNSKSHPHNLIRMVNLLEHYTENVNANYPVNLKLVDYMKYSFEIVNLFFEETLESDMNLTAFYIDELDKNLDEVNFYSQHLYDISEKNDKISRIRKKYNKVL